MQFNKIIPIEKRDTVRLLYVLSYEVLIGFVL
jgi:hypothetical protein